ncbi:hypothetical protein [Geobacter benzoatilyticus]|uniref:Uncharacterized protein n=1 Tax=Geobacter benzoatilyticus TaxID=2815309 RepID=A0ABX7Q1M3_9BACT|nr:hypothetical protein [Geobacter benzoatilyticus]QSV44851.1 hypothetical protein JZM60_11885 [Geobacter benzoatilyticus]
MKRKIMLAVAASVVALLPVMAQAANKLIVKGTDGTTDKMVVTDKGYVGIGSTTPGVALDLVAPVGQSRIVIQTVGTSTIGGGGFIGLHNNDSSINSSLPRKDDRIGFHLFGSKNLTGSILTSAGFQVYAEDNWSSGSLPSYFTFETVKANTTTKYERFRISGNGDVGINSKAPTQRLEVGGGIRLNPAATKVDPNPITKPDCLGNPTAVRGTLWFTQGGAGQSDSLEVCAKDAAGNYDWRKLY